MTETTKRVIQFGSFELKLDTGELRKNGLRIKLQGKAFQILHALLERPGEVVTRDELKSRLWPSDTFVDFESGLNTAANRLRLTLGDSAENPRFVETVARTGYRFIGTINEVSTYPAEPPVIPAPPEREAPASASLPSHRRFPVHLFSGLLIALSVVLFTLWATHRTPAPPTFHQITFRTGIVGNARFGPDGETIIYSANWDGGGTSMFQANTVSPESRALDFQQASLAGLSSSLELALLQHDGSKYRKTLSRVPLNGGGPLTVATNVAGADWSPDGKNLAVYRTENSESVVEYPIGKVLYRTAGAISDLRVSPDGTGLAFLEHPLRMDDGGLVKFIDSHGVAKDLTTNWASAGGLAWAPSGNEIWFSAGPIGLRRGLYAVSLSGKLRQVASLPGTVTLFDISKSGRALVRIDRSRMMMAGSADADSGEQDLSWFDWSHAEDLSADGKLLLFDETGDGGGSNHSVYLRNLEDGTNVRLGDGQAVALSPDAQWALALNIHKPTVLTLIPIGPEPPQTISGEGLKYNWARYFPDRKRLLVGGNFPNQPLRLYVQPVTGGAPVPLKPEIYISGARISPDGREIAGVNQQGKTVLVPASGGEPRELPVPPDAYPLQWSADGTSLFLRESGCSAGARICRFNLATRQCQPWKNIAPADRVGLAELMDVVIAPNEKSYAYSYMRVLSELFVVDGWY